jgi:phosphonoacetate hydrolase
MRQITVNGRAYRWPALPVVVICLDGSNRAYLEAAALSGAAPFLARMLEEGTCANVRSVVPSLTNPNNMSIVTGVPPSAHGIPGNYFWDKRTGEEVMMNSPSYLEADTILAAFAQAGARVAVVTAKDKLRELLGHKLRGVCFSAEKASSATFSENGIADVLEFVSRPQPEVYSAELSEFVLLAGVRLLEKYGPDILYLSTSDYVQHKFAPGTAQANALFALFDPCLQRLDELGAVIVLTADHGMNPKTSPDGAINCVYLLPCLDRLLGAGAARVVLPITDPYVAHHGSLGSYAGIHLPETVLAEPGRVAALIASLSALPGVALVLEKDEACARFGLPPRRTADLVVLAAGDTVLGRDPAFHDTSLLDHPLRSHGGISESRVPLVCNKRVAIPDIMRHNYDAFDLALNHAAAPA